MPDLFHTLIKYDLGHLRIIADLWGLELESQDVDSAAQELCASLLDPETVRDTIEILSAEARAALTDLVDRGGKMEWGGFARKFGGIREMGAGKRDREQPHLKPASAAEVLFYRGLMAKAFFESGRGAQEFAYIPDDLIAPMRAGRMHASSQQKEPLGRVATPVEKTIEFPASDHILDDATTFLAALRLNLEPDSLPSQVQEQAPALQKLLSAARLIKKNIPQTESVKRFLEASRPEALEMLYKAWLDSQTFNELRLIPGLICEGEWTNDPPATRRFLLNLINSLPTGKWWSITAFLRDLKTRHADFQRPAGEYDSWFIKRESDGQYLRGFESWDQVDGALVRYLIQTLHWLGKADLAGSGDEGSITAFRLSSSIQKMTEKGKTGVASDGKIVIPRTCSRAVRYQIARFCEWEAEKKDDYIYSVSAHSLKRAVEQGLKADQLLSLLVKHTNGNVPPALVKALKRWEANGTEARVESLLVLRVSRPEVLEELRRSKAGKFLGERLSPTAVAVKEGAIQKVMAGLAELGLLAEVKS